MDVWAGFRQREHEMINHGGNLQNAEGGRLRPSSPLCVPALETQAWTRDLLWTTKCMPD